MVLVDIYVPSINDDFDFLLDENIPVCQLIVEITGMLSKKLQSSAVQDDSGFQLYSMNAEKILDTEKTLCTNNVTDGCRLVLV